MTYHAKYSLLLCLCLPFLAQAKIPYYQDYVAQYQQIAIDEMERTGIPASIKMAQAILESGAGTSTLSLKANNHFGIKCGGSWKGKTHYRKDDDYNDQGKLVPSCFRKYGSPEESFMAHSEFLQVNRRYGFLFNLDPTDYHGWARGLKKAGYATSKTYSSKLINLIDEYELFLLDSGIAPMDGVLASNDPVPTPPPLVVEPTVTTAPPITASTRAEDPAIADLTGVLRKGTINEVKTVKARKGDTPQTIAEAMNNSAERLVRYNEFLEYPNQVLEGGERVFLQPKRSSYRGRRKDHFIKADETMFDLSQKYGVRLASLYTRNRLDDGMDPAVGSRIRLRGPKVKASEKPKAKYRGNDRPIKVPDFNFEKEKNTEVITASTNNNEDFSSFKPATSFSERKKEKIADTPWYEEEGVLKEETDTPLFSREKATAERPKIVHHGQLDNEEYTGNGTTPATTTTTTTAPKPRVLKEEPREIKREQVSTKPVTKPRETAAPTRPTATTSTAKAYHKVSKGETLYRISKKFDISVAQIKALNGLSSNVISVGQRLRIQ